MSRFFLLATALAGALAFASLARAEAGERRHGDRAFGHRHEGAMPARALAGRSWRHLPPVAGVIRHRSEERRARWGRPGAWSRHAALTVRRGTRDAGWMPRWPVGFGYDSYAPGYGSSGYGYGSTGYGYGGDFSAAYTSDYDDGRTLGYATADATYGGEPYDIPDRAGPLPGYASGRGFMPAIPPAGGLAVYAPGSYGPGPRIVVIPSQYGPGRDTFGCHCASRLD